MSSQHTLISIFILALSGCAALSTVNFEALHGPAQPRERIVAELRSDQIDYWRQVKPILENRCVVCHSCYDAPVSSSSAVSKASSVVPVRKMFTLRGYVPASLRAFMKMLTCG